VAAINCSRTSPDTRDSRVSSETVEAARRRFTRVKKSNAAV
jgi:hypothetical protein